MQIKTINKTIRLKLESWLQSITDENLRNDIKDNLVLSGGSIVSMLLGEDVNDYDIYLQDRSVLLRLTKYYVDPIDGATVLDGHLRDSYIDDWKDRYAGAGKVFEEHPSREASCLRNLKEDQVKISIQSAYNGGLKVESALQSAGEGVEVPKFRVSFLSPNAISLTDNIQIVIRFHGTPNDIHKTFDFIHATNYFTFKDGVVTNIKAVESILTKQLYYQGSMYPLTSVIRAKKFIKRNWNIHAGEYLKMMFQISLLDLQNIDVLEEQLIGVDVAYFDALIQALRKHAERHPDFKISAEYLNNIVDKIFNDAEDTASLEVVSETTIPEPAPFTPTEFDDLPW